MKNYVFFTLLLAGCFSGSAGTLTNASPLRTNILSIHLVAAGLVSNTNVITTPFGEIMAKPILSDADFVAWDVTNNTFVITPRAAMRVAGSCWQHVVPFVLMCGGEPIYRGMFGTSLSSSGESTPEILTDAIPFDLQGTKWTTNDNEEFKLWAKRYGFILPSDWNGMTNATTNITLRIDRGYPSPDGFGLGVDRRGDKRITAAVEKLFGKSNR
jgi:hypothetical protein